MNISNRSFNTPNLVVESKVAFKGDEEETKSTPKSDGFKVNENLEYMGATVTSLATGSFLGGVIGVYSSLLAKSEQYAERLPKAKIVRFAVIGAAVGAAVSALMLPFTKERTRERIYQKQLEFDVMSGVSQKAKNGELSPQDAAAYLNANAMTKMAQAQAAAANNSTTNTMGLMAGSYMVGKSSK